MNGILISHVLLTYTAVILIVVLTVAVIFLIKLFVDMSKLINNIDEVTTLVKHELEPTLTELQQTLKSLNSIAGATDKQITNIKNIVSKISNISGALFGQVRSVSGSFINGLTAGLRLFSSNNK